VTRRVGRPVWLCARWGRMAALHAPNIRMHPFRRRVRHNIGSHNCLCEGVVVRPSSMFPASAGAALRGCDPPNHTISTARDKSSVFDRGLAQYVSWN
jgi:hypothetical protein